MHRAYVHFGVVTQCVTCLADDITGSRGDADGGRFHTTHEGYAWGYRIVLPTPDADPFRPEVLVHSCENTPIRVIREVLTIPPPGHPAMPVVPAVATDAERRLAAKFTGRRCVIRTPRV
jgi:hypothetical protein